VARIVFLKGLITFFGRKNIPYPLKTKS